MAATPTAGSIRFFFIPKAKGIKPRRFSY